MRKQDFEHLRPEGGGYVAPDLEVLSILAEQGFVSSDLFDGEIDDPYMDYYDEF